MSVVNFVEELRKRGVKLEPNGNNLQVEAPEGVLTGEMRAALIEQKAEILSYFERRRTILSRVAEAIRTAESKFPDRFDWSKDTPEAKIAGDDLDLALAGYVEGTHTIDDVQSAWRRYIQALDTQYSPTAKQQHQLPLIEG
jgi:hypothetical protein